MKLQKIRFELIILILLASLTRFWQLFTPNAVVFDEVYFKAFAAHYLDGNYFFDIHPPLGKLLFAGLAHLLQLDPASMIDGTALILRILPACAGILLVPVIWAVLRRLDIGRPLAFLGAFLIIADNALATESRFILMDSMLLLSGFTSLYFYLRARDTARHRLIWLSLAALAAGAAISIKWTGLGALALIMLVWLWDQRQLTTPLLRRLSELATLALLPLIIYTTSFWIHFQLLPHSGEGDAFMTDRFQATLQGNPNYLSAASMSFPEKFIELNTEMYRANQTLTASHPYGSHWYSWPLQERPIYYYQGDQLENGTQAHIYLLGNPIIWWGLWLALSIGLIYVWISRRRLQPNTVAGLALTGTGFIINLLPFVGVARVMFLYHYFFSFIFSILFVTVLWSDIITHSTSAMAKSRYAYVSTLILIILGFIYFAPLTYGTPLSTEALQQHMWLRSWR